MKRKIFQIMVLFISVLSILGCEKLQGSSPRTVLKNYLDASTKGNHKEAYSYISANDKAVKDLETYINENDEFDSPYRQIMVNNISYEISKLEKSNETATAYVEMTMPDIGAIIKEVMKTAFQSTQENGNQNKIEDLLASKMKNGDIPLTTQEKSFQLRKEEEGWKVFLDWKAEKLKEEKEAKINSLLAEAEELKESKKLHGAVEKYEKVLELDSEMVEAKEGLEETKEEINEFEKKQDYIKNVELYELTARYFSTYSDEKVPGVQFKLKNNGDKTLNEVEVTVYFKDADGTIIAEEDYHPVLVTEYSYGDNKPLKPNYIWQMERGKFYKADSVPSEWKEGAASAKITDIEFSE